MRPLTIKSLTIKPLATGPLPWHLQQAAARLGAVGLIGAALVVFAIAIQLFSVQPRRVDVAELRSQLTASSKLATDATGAQERDVQTNLDRFYAVFPPRSSLLPQLKVLHQLAGSRQLIMGDVDYTLTRLNATPLERYQFKYVLHADYPALRLYLADVLSTLSNASLDNVEIKRSGDVGGLPEATLSMSLFFVGKGSSP